MQFPISRERLRRLGRRKFTIVAMSSSGGQARSFCIPLPTACIGVAFATGVLLLLCITYFHMLSRFTISTRQQAISDAMISKLTSENLELKRAVESQEEQLFAVKKKAETLEKKMVALDRLGMEIRSILNGGSRGTSSGTPNRGSSRPSTDVPFSSSTVNAVEGSTRWESDIQALESSLDSLLDEVETLSREFNDLEGAAIAHRRKADHTPSFFPVRGRITSNYGRRAHPITRRMHYHTGIDIAVPTGTAVRTTAAGYVAYAGWRAGYGLCIEISHGAGLSTLYAHLSGLRVSKGKYVKKGQVIGYSGSSGTSTGPHVHYEVRLYGRPQNPWGYAG
ncbi:MAG TPA: M23 family metallopeptidase [Firmicutes bacterium]|nr:M23 family metallopeptidase [Bacillota bacterium]